MTEYLEHFEALTGVNVEDFFQSLFDGDPSLLDHSVGVDGVGGETVESYEQVSAGTDVMADTEMVATLEQLKDVRQAFDELQEELRVERLTGGGTFENWDYLNTKFDALYEKILKLDAVMADTPGFSDLFMDRYEKEMLDWMHGWNLAKDAEIGDPDEFFKYHYDKLKEICKNIDKDTEWIEKYIFSLEKKLVA